MPLVKKYAFPFAMVLALGLSALLLATGLQAAPMPRNPFEPRAAVLPTAPATPTLTLVEQGRILFVAKGCLVCHNHPAFAEIRHQTMNFGFSDIPTLANLKIDPDYLKRWLHDPRALKPTTQMPNLNLSDDEIAALAAFLTNAGN